MLASCPGMGLMMIAARRPGQGTSARTGRSTLLALGLEFMFELHDLEGFPVHRIIPHQCSVVVGHIRHPQQSFRGGNK